MKHVTLSIIENGTVFLFEDKSTACEIKNDIFNVFDCAQTDIWICLNFCHILKMLQINDSIDTP